MLDARDQFHVHLAHKSNVFSTAIGPYLVRDGDPDEKQATGAGERSPVARERTLLNSRVKPWSWPCIIVFVKEWQTLADLASRPDDVVPPFVYMPDGRTVPVCVVVAAAAQLPAHGINPARMDRASLGIGSPLVVDAQGLRRMGTAACLVSDGGDFYVLTNTHLAGEIGRPVRALLNGVPEVVGTTHGTRNLTERTFTDVYPNLACRDAVVNIDAAIVRLDDCNQWAPGLIEEPLGDVADFNATTASLSWIGQPVVAHGGASGEMKGEIKALFYRCKSIGGRDYIADFVIGGRADGEPLVTQSGDSGSLWCLDGVMETNTRSPLALEWGGQRVTSGPAAGQYLQLSLATSLSVILRELRLDVVSDATAERTEYWGPVGHYKIGQQACFLVRNQALRKFFVANLPNISFSTDAQIKQATHLKASVFVELSDVPDVVCKTNINRVKREVARAQENWNHYADIDLPGAGGKTLLQMYEADPNSLNPEIWAAFYKKAPVPSKSTLRSNNKGALPFRVWQVFAKMIDFAKDGDGARFLTAAGCMAHYIGDGCQPLHSSQHSDGLHGASTGVHSTYEQNMVDAFPDRIAAGMSKAMTNLDFHPRTIRSPRDAAMAVMDLMAYCHKILPPATICDVYDRARPKGHKNSPTADKAVLQELWTNCGQETVQLIAAGAVTLAAVWEAAWTLAGAAENAVWIKTAFDGAKDLMPIYEDLDFLPSKHLPYLGLADLPGSDAPGTKAAVKKK